MRNAKAFDWLVLAALVIAWGSAFAALRISTAHISPLWNTAGRLMVAVPVLVLVVIAMRDRLPPLRDKVWLAYAVLGFVAMALPFTLYAFSAQRLPSAVNAICNGASPIFTGLLAHAFVAGERLTARKAAGVLLGFAGLVVLVAPRLQQGLNVETVALGAALVGAFLYAVGNIIVRRAPPVPSAVGALLMCGWAAVFAIGAAASLEPSPPWPPWQALLAVAGLGVFTTGLASVGYVFLIKRRGPLFVSMAIYLAPIWATGLGMAALGERPGWSALMALALILSGVALATYAAPDGKGSRPAP